jgi:hypothetical protein
MAFLQLGACLSIGTVPPSVYGKWQSPPDTATTCVRLQAALCTMQQFAHHGRGTPTLPTKAVVRQPSTMQQFAHGARGTPTRSMKAGSISDSASHDFVLARVVGTGGLGGKV